MSPPKIKKIALIGILGIFVSIALDPPSSRFIIPYFPALIISAVYCISETFKKYLPLVIFLTIFSSTLIVGLRLIAIQKYIPYLLRKENKTQFLTRVSAKLPETFIDSDGFIKNLPPSSKILVDKLHNLFYLDRDFDHTSWVKTWNGYDYLVTIGERGENIPGELINTNQVGIQVFKLNK
jgi:hypothetical protein